MVGSITESIRYYLNIVNQQLAEKQKAKQAPQEVKQPEFGITVGKNFQESLKRYEATLPDIKEKLKRFIEIKKADPLARYGTHDYPFTSGSPLSGFMHCHLGYDTLLVYTLKNRNINLLLICNHAEIEGRRQNRTKNLLTA